MVDKYASEIADHLRLMVKNGPVCPGLFDPSRYYLLYKHKNTGSRDDVYHCLEGTNIYWKIQHHLCFMYKGNLLVIDSFNKCTQWNPTSGVIDVHIDDTIVERLQELLDISRCHTRLFI